MRNCLLLITFMSAFFTTNALASSVSARWDELYGSEITFDVYRKGKKVGEYSTSFTSNDKLLNVDISMKLEIPILFGWTYDYSYTARELWQDQEILSLDVSVNDNGDMKRLSAENIDQTLTGQIEGEKISATLPLLPTHHYNADVLNDSRVFNTLTGQENNVKIIREGKDTIDIAGRSTQVKKFRYSGDLNDTTVWYDDKNRWVKLAFPGTDGTLIELRCTSCTSCTNN